MCAIAYNYVLYKPIVYSVPLHCGIQYSNINGKETTQLVLCICLTAQHYKHNCIYYYLTTLSYKVQYNIDMMCKL